MEAKNSINISDFIARLADANEGIEASELSPTRKLKEIEDWDSLAVLVTVIMVETEYGVEVKGSDIDQCETVQQIADLVASKNGVAG